MDVIEKLALISVIIFDDLPVIKLVKLQDIVRLFIFPLFWIYTSTLTHTDANILKRELRQLINGNSTLSSSRYITIIIMLFSSKTNLISSLLLLYIYG